MESLNYLAGGKRKFSVSPRLAQLEQEFRESGGEWEDILLSELFTISTTKGVDKGKIQVSEHSGKYAFIGRTPVNNGIQGYTDYLGFAPNPKNTFSVIQIGENIAQYREQEWYASQNLFLLTPKQHKILDTRMFIIASINCALKIYTGAYNSYPTLAKLKETTISLPCYANGAIAFDFMEGYIRELEEERVHELAAYLKESGLQDCVLTPAEQKAIQQYQSCKLTSKGFTLGSLFEIMGIKQSQSQKDIPTDEYGVPYIIQSTRNNMFSRKVNKQWLIEHNEAPVCGNAIALGVTLPAVSYQPIEFGASQIITARANFLNENIGLFFVGVLGKHMYQFSYSKKPGIKIYKDMVISLPITPTGAIDYTFMETFISAQKKLAIRKVVEWKDKQIATTKQLVNN